MSVDIYPKNVVELMDMFPTEESCLEYLSKLRWPDGYQCIRCSGKNIAKMGEDYTAARPANMIVPLFLAPCFKAPINHCGYGFKLSGMW